MQFVSASGNTFGAFRAHSSQSGCNLPMKRFEAILKIAAASILLSSMLAFTHPTSGATAQNDDQRGGEPTQCSATPDGRLLFLSLPADDSSGSDLFVADPASGEIRTFEGVSAIDSLSPLRAPGYALTSTEDDQTYLIDLANETAVTLDFPNDIGTIFESIQSLPVGTTPRTTVLTDGRDSFLLNIGTGTVQDLRDLLPADALSAPLFTYLSPDEATLAVWDTGRIWLIPTDDPSRIRVLSRGVQGSPGGFSPDGSLLLYSRSAGDDAGRELVIEPVDASTSPEIIATGDIVNGVFAGDGQRVVYDRILRNDGEPTADLNVINLKSGKSTPLLEHEVDAVSLYAAPSSNRVLLGINAAGDGWNYTDIDLETGETRELTSIQGLPLFGQTGSQFRLAMPVIGMGNLPDDPGIYQVDLGTGTATQLAPIDLEEIQAINQPQFTLDGNAAILATFGPDAQSLLHIDVDDASATEIRTTPFAGATLSPDGCWMAIVDRKPGGSSSDVDLVIQSIGARSTTSFGPGLNPVWIEE